MTGSPVRGLNPKLLWRNGVFGLSNSIMRAQISPWDRGMCPDQPREFSKSSTQTDSMSSVELCPCPARGVGAKELYGKDDRMDDIIQQAGVIGIFALLVIREILSRVRPGNGATVEKMRHESLRDLIIHVNDNLTAQTALLRDVAKDVAAVKGKVG